MEITTSIPNLPTIAKNVPILPILVRMKNNGYEEITITSLGRNLKHLDKHCDLYNPQNTIAFIMNKKCLNSWKNHLLKSYAHYLKFYEIEYPLRYLKEKAHHTRIPTTEELDTLISSAGYPLCLKLRLSKETGIRPVELVSLKVNDFDNERKTIYPTSAKNGAPRTIKLSQKLTHLLQVYIIKNDRNPNDLIFKTTGQVYRNSYMHSRGTTAKKLGNPRLTKIRLYDFRHYFATRLYARCNSILYVQQQMGHKKISTTMIYTQLINFQEEEEYIVKIATTLKEETSLIEKGFIYIKDRDGYSIYKKRK